MADFPEIEAGTVRRIALIGPPESIEDAQAVVIAVGKAVGGQITQVVKAAVVEWLNRSPKLTDKDRKDLLALMLATDCDFYLS